MYHLQLSLVKHLFLTLRVNRCPHRLFLEGAKNFGVSGYMLGHVGSKFDYFVAVLSGHAEAMLGHVEATC